MEYFCFVFCTTYRDLQVIFMEDQWDPLSSHHPDYERHEYASKSQNLFLSDISYQYPLNNSYASQIVHACLRFLIK
jgi:hypothetical protein